MKNGDESLWTIDELSERVASELGNAGYGGVPSGRVRDVPDLRTIRYYTTLGLLDRPAAMRGRTALYGPRHLLQLVVIKRLQARGLSLAAVQERVIGASNARLRRIAVAETGGPQAMSASPPQAPQSRAESFWRLPPAAAEDRVEEESPSVHNIPLAAGLVLSLEAGRALGDDDLRVIRMAAAPLIEILKLRGLIGIGPPQQQRGDTQ